MGIQDFEIEPVDEWQDFCNAHGCYFYHGSGCYACGEDSVDRAIQDKLDDKALSQAQQP